MQLVEFLELCRRVAAARGRLNRHCTHLLDLHASDLDVLRRRRVADELFRTAWLASSLAI